MKFEELFLNNFLILQKNTKIKTKFIAYLNLNFFSALQPPPEKSVFSGIVRPKRLLPASQPAFRNPALVECDTGRRRDIRPPSRSEKMNIFYNLSCSALEETKI